MASGYRKTGAIEIDFLAERTAAGRAGVTFSHG
jgi:hypothetical protein